jgi:uncharacterized protein (UPF0332 family)
MSELSKEFNDNFFKHIAELYIDPEIKRRRETNLLPDNFVLHAVQVIMNHDTPIDVRLNDEVCANVIGNFAKPVSDGDQISIDDLDTIVDMQLTNCDPNAGHVTLLVHKGTWVGRFDFRYNASRSRGHVEAAREFLYAALASLEKGHLRSVTDNLFSATELMAKGLLLMHDEKMLSSRSHGIVHSHFNQWRHLGNTDPRYAALLNKLTSLRGASRYLDKEFQLTLEECRNMAEVAEDMFEDSRMRIPQDRK